MAKKSIHALSALLVLMPLAVAVVGCQGDPTNAPTVDAVKEANKKRAAAIDNDPSLTPEQRQMMKSHMGGVTGSMAGTQGQAPTGRNAPK